MACDMTWFPNIIINEFKRTLARYTMNFGKLTLMMFFQLTYIIIEIN